jgi:predicted N-acetyltransferase YhbS
MGALECAAGADIMCASAALSELPQTPEYLALYARKNDTARIGKTFVALDEAGRIAGYITLSNAQVERNKLPETVKLPRYPVPALLIGKLAVDKTMHGKGIGSWLLCKAFEKAIQIAAISAVYAVIVDATSHGGI